MIIALCYPCGIDPGRKVALVQLKLHLSAYTSKHKAVLKELRLLKFWLNQTHHVNIALSHCSTAASSPAYPVLNGHSSRGPGEPDVDHRISHSELVIHL